MPKQKQEQNYTFLINPWEPQYIEKWSRNGTIRKIKIRQIDTSSDKDTSSDTRDIADFIYNCLIGEEKARQQFLCAIQRVYSLANQKGIIKSITNGTFTDSINSENTQSTYSTYYKFDMPTLKNRFEKIKNAAYFKVKNESVFGAHSRGRILDKITSVYENIAHMDAQCRENGLILTEAYDKLLLIIQNEEKQFKQNEKNIAEYCKKLDQYKQQKGACELQHKKKEQTLETRIKQLKKEEKEKHAPLPLGLNKKRYKRKKNNPLRTKIKENESTLYNLQLEYRTTISHMEEQINEFEAAIKQLGKKIDKYAEMRLDTQKKIISDFNRYVYNANEYINNPIMDVKAMSLSMLQIQINKFALNHLLLTAPSFSYYKNRGSKQTKVYSSILPPPGKTPHTHEQEEEKTHQSAYSYTNTSS